MVAALVAAFGKRLVAPIPAEVLLAGLETVLVAVLAGEIVAAIAVAIVITAVTAIPAVTAIGTVRVASARLPLPCEPFVADPIAALESAAELSTEEIARPVGVAIERIRALVCLLYTSPSPRD